MISMVPLTITDRIRMPALAVAPAVLDTLKAAFTYPNKKRASMMHLMRGKPWLWKSMPEFEVSWGAEVVNAEATITFPRGGIGKIRKALEDAGLEWDELDNRLLVPHLHNYRTNVALWTHQREAVDACLEREQGILRAGTGSGKTSSLLALAAEAEQTCLVIMNSAALQEQWKERAMTELGLAEDDIGVLGGGSKKVRPFTLGIVNSVVRKMDDVGFRREWGMVLCDEVHMAASTMFQKCVDRFPAWYRIGASADQRRKDGREFLIHDAFGDVVHDAKREDLILAGKVLDVEVYAHETNEEADWYGMPTEENPTRRVDFMALVDQLSGSAERNALALRIVADEVAKGEQVILFVHRREHAERLLRMISELGIRGGLMLGGATSSDEFERTLVGMRAGNMQVGIGTYQAVGASIDIPRLAVGVAVTPCGANRQMFGQARGRVCRAPDGKMTARLHVLWDSRIFTTHLKNILSWNGHAHVKRDGDWERLKNRG